VLLSEVFAILAAACTAGSGMLIGETAGRVDVFRFGRWNMVTTFIFCAALALLIGGWRNLELWQFELLAGSSASGIMLASSTYYAAIYSAGPRITALLFSLTAPFALAFGYLVLGETIDLRQGLGVAVVLAGVALAVMGGKRSKPEERKTTPAVRVPWQGIAFGVLTALGQAGSVLLARPAMASGVEPFTAMAVRSGLAALFYCSLMAIKALRRPYQFARRDLAMAVGSAILGTALGMALLMAALAHGNVGIVSTLSSMTPVMILPMVWFRHRVRPSAWAWLGAVLAVVGVALISLR
jgi:drug/metabolite transporter (DMT)-like permease